jgi:hypothetical protein
MLMLCLYSISAFGECTDWGYALGAPTHRYIYAGSIGKQPVRMMLGYDETRNIFSGAYGYRDQPGAMIVVGRMLPGKVDVNLDEYDHSGSGKPTGYFELNFSNRRNSSSNSLISKDSGCDYLVGTWNSFGSKTKYPVELGLTGELDPAGDKAREVNEVTALMLKNAMLKADRKAFASLLRYPFCSAGEDELTHIWDTPQSVIAHYQEIMPFTLEEVRDSSVHILQSFGSTTLYMKQSVVIQNGKVISICADSCSSKCF